MYDLPGNVFFVCVCLSLFEVETVERIIYNSISRCWTQ